MLDLNKTRFYAVMVCACAMLLVACSAASAGSYDDAVKASNPFAYWRFEDASSANGQLADDAMNNHDGTYTGTVGLTAAGGGVPLFGDATNKAASFSGSGHIDIGRLGTLGTAMGTDGVGMTVEFWVNSSATGNNGAFGSSTSGGSSFFVNLDERPNGNPSDDRIRVLAMSNGRQWYTGQDSDTNVTDGSWNYVAVTVQFSGTTETMSIYMADAGDTTATLVTTKTKTVTAGGSGSNFNRNLAIGSIRYNDATGLLRFNGLLDEVAVYDKVLSTSDMDAHLLASTVPEPATIILLLLGLPLALRRRRK
ncbi:MAG: LamG domain-containing protein [Phycisphaerae bacterium]|nr:LamG domain-containing protein [Phycisphaerae bacterium]